MASASEFELRIEYGQYHLYDSATDYDAMAALERFEGELTSIGTALAVTVGGMVESVSVECSAQDLSSATDPEAVRYDWFIDVPSGVVVIGLWDGSPVGRLALDAAARHRVVIELVAAEGAAWESHRITFVPAAGSLPPI